MIQTDRRRLPESRITVTCNTARDIVGNIRRRIKIAEIGTLENAHESSLAPVAGAGVWEIRMETMISPSRAVIYVFTEVGWGGGRQGVDDGESEREEAGGEGELAQDSLSGGRKKISNVCSA